MVSFEQKCYEVLLAVEKGKGSFNVHQIRDACAYGSAHLTRCLVALRDGGFLHKPVEKWNLTDLGRAAAREPPPDVENSALVATEKRRVGRPPGARDRLPRGLRPRNTKNTVRDGIGAMVRVAYLMGLQGDEIRIVADKVDLLMASPDDYQDSVSLAPVPE